MYAYRHCLAYAICTFRKIQRKAVLRISMVKYGRIYKTVHLKSKLQFTRNLTDHSMTIPPPVLSPSSILPSHSSKGAFIPARKNSARVS